VLAAYDIVADRSGSTLTLKKAEAEKRHDPIPFMIAQALKTLEANKIKQAEAIEKASVVKGAFGAAAMLDKAKAAGADQAAAMLDKAKAAGADQAAAMLDKAKAAGADQAAAMLDKAKGAAGLGTPEAEKSEDTEEQPASLVTNNVETGDTVDDGAVAATAEEPEVLGKAPDWIRLKDLYLEANQLDKALEAAQNMVAIQERNCSYWGSLAVVQREMGDVANAIVSREKQSDIYHAWYDRPLDERGKLKKAFDKLSDKEKETSEFYVAAPECHTADGGLAAATFAAGDLLTIENLYRERMDLDSTLAVVAGNALIAQGEYAHAQEPLRQALKMGGPQKSARRSLAVLYAEQGDWEAASKLFERINKVPESTVGLWLWLDHLADAEGEDAAMAKAKAIAHQFPDDLDAQLALARSVSLGSNEPLKAKTRRATEGIFLKRVERYPRNGYVVAVHAIWLNLWEPGSDEALAQAEKALSLGGAGTVYWALAQVHEARGNIDEARHWRMRAAQRGTANIGYARMFTQ
jgi:hypothetical protein